MGKSFDRFLSLINLYCDYIHVIDIIGNQKDITYGADNYHNLNAEYLVSKRTPSDPHLNKYNVNTL